MLGLCPQQDALLDLLTPEEHLVLHARLRGLPARAAAGEAARLVCMMGLEAYRGREAAALSGGNRRKLCAAVALCGGPPALLLLDETSAGMDPVARRELWEALRARRGGVRSVLLTTHHLEEMEGLAGRPHRVAVMVAGQLHCVGTLQQLRSRLGASYEVRMWLSDPAHGTEAEELMCAACVGCSVAERAGCRMAFRVPKAALRDGVGTVFAALEGSAMRRAGRIADYAVGEASLEQLFLAIARKAAPSPSAEGADGA